MRRTVYLLAVIGLAITVCVVVAALGTLRGEKPQLAPIERERLELAMANLQGQIRQIKSQKNAAELQVRRLQEAVSALTEKETEDQQVIEDLWTLAVAGTRRQREADVEDPTSIPAIEDRDAPARRDEREDRKYDIDTVKQILASLDGNLDAALHQIVGPEEIDRILQEHAGQPAYWAAAASLAPDQETALEYLREAARLYPDSPAVLSALVSAQIAAGQIDESALAYLSELKRVDPTNALGDCYAAQCQFQAGDILGALQSLAQASAKGRFADDPIGLLMARYDYLLNEGVSDPVALGLSAFTLPLEHLGMIRQLESQAIEQARSLSAAGRIDDALKIADDVSNIGRTISSSGRFLIHDRVGIALQQAGLAEQRQVYEALGDTAMIQEVDLKLQAIQERSATIETMVQGFGTVLARMTEEDLADYVDATILNGEFATLQNVPEIAQALQQAQASPQEEAAQTTPPPI